MTRFEIIKGTAWAAWLAVNVVAYRRLVRDRCSEPSLSDRIPRWYVAVVVAGTIAMVLAVAIAGLATKQWKGH